MENMNPIYRVCYLYNTTPEKDLPACWGVWLSIVNAGHMKHRQDVPPLDTFLQALGITGFIFLQFLM